MSGEQADILTHQVATDWTVAKLSDGDRALCRFAQRLTASPAKMQQTHILDLREAGFDDVAIHDASQIASYFNYINRIADSLNVDLEADVHAWEQSTP